MIGSGESYGYANGARWLDQFMRRHALTKQDVNLILGVNPARVHEWLKREKPFGPEVQQRLERWEADGCPRFAYWENQRVYRSGPRPDR